MTNNILSSHNYEGEGLINTITFVSDLTSLCASAGSLALVALLAWMAAIATGRSWVMCLALAIQSALAGACIPFETMTLRRSLLPNSVVQIASVLGWQISPQHPEAAAAGSWCSILAVAGGFALCAFVGVDTGSKAVKQNLRVRLIL